MYGVKVDTRVTTVVLMVFIHLFRNKQFWLVTWAFCLPLGVFEVWDILLDVNLSYIGLSQVQ